MPTTQFYDRVYRANRQDASIFGLPEQRLVDFISNTYFSGRNACDLGCGDGRQAIYLALNGWHVLAVDNSQKALERLKAQIKRLGLQK